MRISSCAGPASRSAATASIWALAFASLASLSHAFTANSISNPNLDFQYLGQVGFAGDYTGISYYEYEGQSEKTFHTNGSESLLARLPNGMFQSLLEADASILDMCAIDNKIFLAGNFTSLKGTQSPAVGYYDLDAGTVTPLEGVEGQVDSLFCDSKDKRVYLGGSFRVAGSANAVAWSTDGDGGWVNLPFAGFNGPVNAITQTSDGHIIFAGGFSGLGNQSSSHNKSSSNSQLQVVNIEKALVEVEQESPDASVSDPKNAVCNTDRSKSFRLRDGVPGAWKATFGFNFTPKKLRLRNTHLDGYGTKTWRYTAFPINGIMNFTYVDPATGDNATCTSECPLSNDPSIDYQEFTFVNDVEMNMFRIDISDYYGAGAGLDTVELLQEPIFTYAIEDFNEPTCANTTTPSKATTTGPWKVTSSGISKSEYLSAVIPSPVAADAASVTFFPDIKKQGNYSVNVYTPGCNGDNTCVRRGQFMVNATLTSDSTPQVLTSRDGNDSPLYQTNYFDKFDPVYFGMVDATSDSFRPSVTLYPVAGQNVAQGDLTLVAQRVEFVLVNSTGGLTGVYEYDSEKNAIVSDEDGSAFNKLSSTFSPNSAVTTMVTSGDVTYVGGNFTSDSTKNIAGVNTKDSSIIDFDGGLDGGVLAMYLLDNQLYVGGQFDNTQKKSVSGLNNVGSYDTSSNTWSALGAGVDGVVKDVVPLQLNLTDVGNETAIALSGDFKQIEAFDGNDAVDCDGFAVWIPSKKNWLLNLDTPVPLLEGMLSAAILDLPNNLSLYAGSVSSQALRATGVSNETSQDLQPFPIKIHSPKSSSSSGGLSRRDTPANHTNDIQGVVTGAYYKTQMTILGGHFTADASDNSVINNIALIDGADSNKVSGLGQEINEDAVVLAIALQDSNLFAGGRINSTVGDSEVNGLVMYNLDDKSFPSQPPALAGSNVTVTSITIRQNSKDVYVGGSFDSAGSLPCPGVCMLNPETNQWNRPGFGLKGDVSTLLWTGENTMLAAGDLRANDTSTYLMSFDSSSSTWSTFDGASALPGPVTTLTLGNNEGSQIWAAGNKPDGSLYLMKYDGSWKTADIDVGSDTILSSLQVFSLSQDHDETDLVGANRALMLTGSISIPDFGTASSAIYDGKTLQPYALTSNADNKQGSIAKVFVSNQDFFTSPSAPGGMPLGFVVLIGLAIALGLMLLVVAAGLALDRYRKKREGYVPAPTSMYDRGSGMQRIPPRELLETLNKGRPGAPHV